MSANEDAMAVGRARVLAPGRGSVAIEFAIVLPALLMFLLGIVDMGRFTWTKATLDFATSAAARCAAVNTTLCGSNAQIQTYAVSQAPGMTLPTSVFSSSGAAQACGVRVSAAYPFVFITPWIAPQGVTLLADACYPTSP